MAKFQHVKNLRPPPFSDNGTSYQEMLLEMTGQKTVPNVFINKKHIGGCDKTLQVSNESRLAAQM